MIAKDCGNIRNCIAAVTLLLMACGSALAQPANTSATRVTAVRSLAGHKAMSIDVEGGFGATVEEHLRSFGVTILPLGAMPVLRLAVRQEIFVSGDNFPTRYVVFTIRLEFEQLVTLAGSPPRQSAAITWRSSAFMGWNVRGVDRAGVVQVMNEFGEAYRLASAPAATSTAARIPPPAMAPPIANGLQQYGRVADDYVPPIPANFSANPSGDFIIMMTKDAPGALTEIRVGQISHANFIGSGTVIPYTKVIQDDMNAINAESNRQSVITCTYNGDRYSVRVYWYKAEPFNANSQRLTQRLPNHPLLSVGPPQSTCPANLELAIAATLQKK